MVGVAFARHTVQKPINHGQDPLAVQNYKIWVGQAHNQPEPDEIVDDPGHGHVVQMHLVLDDRQTIRYRPDLLRKKSMQIA